jgi:integrase
MNEATRIRTELPAQQYIQQLPSIQNLLLHLEAKGRSPNTIRAYEQNLKALAQRADLQNPKEVELAIARYKRKKSNQTITNNYKSKLCDHYATYCKFYKIEWEKPIYTPEPQSIQPPAQETIQMLVASAKRELSLKLDISAQTGLRPIEIHGLKTSDLHPDTQTLTARSHKGCDPRPPMKITPELVTRIQTHINNKKLKPADLLFTGDERRYGEHFRRFRNKLAEKLNNPSIKSIRLYDLRHAYCTRQLRRTQNAEIVRQIMGHKKLNTTQKYLHLIGYQLGDWIVEGTTDKERAKQLLKEDFQFQLTTPDGTMIFRKPK